MSNLNSVETCEQQQSTMSQPRKLNSSTEMHYANPTMKSVNKYEECNKSEVCQKKKQV